MKRECLQADRRHQLPSVVDRNFDPVGKRFERDLKPPVGIGELRERFLANLLGGDRKILATRFLETRSRSLKLHGAPHGADQARIPVQVELDACGFIRH
jgi:hypothetical protein